MDITLIAMFISIGLFLGMLLLAEAGRRIGIAGRKGDPDAEAKDAGPADAAVFGLLGLLIAFTFSGAASRFEDRRHLVTEEANAIGTAYLRIDLLPADAQPEIRDLFRRYLDVRAATYSSLSTPDEAKVKLAEAAALQADIWAKAMAAGRRPDAPAQALFLVAPALNAMIDITTTRVMATRNHPPLVIFLLLGGLGLVGALILGYSDSGAERRSVFHTVVFAAVLSLTVYVIVDLEFPNLGLIRVGTADQVLVELRQSIK